MKPASSSDIRTIYQQVQEAGEAIAIYQLPDKTTINYITGPVLRNIKDGKSAFAFAPFDTAQKPYYISAQNQSSLTKRSPPNKNKLQKSTSRQVYIKLVDTIKSAIQKGKFKKVVAARMLAIARPHTFDPLDFFLKLCEKYTTTFVSLTYIPGVGLWIGASPEILVSESSDKLTVYSLAGTRRLEDANDWNDKELKEQSIVTDFIRKRLSKTLAGKISEKGPLTHNAGQLKHLLTIFTAKQKDGNSWKALVKTLHPTPAVAGLPQKKSIKLIHSQEHFDRSFYSGYLGPVNTKGRTDLFVNLRCIQVTDSQLLFYAGCGITADSDPAKEWQESERKIDVLKSLL